MAGFHVRPLVQALRPVGVPAVLLTAGIVPVVAGIGRLAGLMFGRPSPADARFFEHPLPVTLHILAVIPYALLGAWQFSPALRRPCWHSTAGRLLVPLGLIAALSGLWMTLRYPWPAGDGEALYVMRLGIGVAMTWAIERGVAALRRADYAAHGAWMLRGYALGMGAGTQVFTHLPWLVFVDTAPGESARAVMMGLAWILNTLAAEYVIRTRRLAAVAAPPIGRASPRPSAR